MTVEYPNAVESLYATISVKRAEVELVRRVSKVERWVDSTTSVRRRRG